MTRMLHSGLTVLLLVVLAMGCSASTTATPAATEPLAVTDPVLPQDDTIDAAMPTPAQDTSDSPATDEQSSETASPAAASSDDGGASENSSTEPGPAAEPPAGPVLLAGLEPIVQLTSHSGNGTRPLLAWEPLPTAEFYSLAVYAPDGQVYWASLLTENETFVGGPIQIDETKPGPRVGSDMSWSVVALDGDMVPVGSSAIRPIAP